MSTPTITTVTQLNQPGNLNGAPPAVEKIKFDGGRFPSATERKSQIQEQQKLDTTVLDAGSGKGDSKLPGHDLRNGAAKKAETRVEAKKETPAAKGGPETKEEPKAEADEVEEKTKQANAAVARSRAHAKDLRETKAKLAELEAALPKTREYEQMFKDARKDPIGFLTKAGLDLETVAQAAINGGKRPEELVKMEELEAKIKERDDRDAREKAQAQKNHELARINNGVAQHFTEVNQAITSEPDKYEFCNMKMQGEKVPLVIDNGSTFMVEPAISDAYSIQEHAAANLGRILTPTELADTLEKYYEDEYSALKSTKKIQKLLGLSGEAAKDEPKKGSKKESPTLGQRKLASEPATRAASLPKLNRKDYKNDKQFMDALVKQGEERMRLLKETKA